MDPLDELLYAVRANGAVLGTPALAAGSAVRFTDAATLTLCAPLRGEGWLLVDGESVHLKPGETAVVCSAEPFVFSTDLAAGTDPIDVRCDGTVGAETAGGTVLLAGAFYVRQEMPRRLLNALPPVMIVAEDLDCAPLLGYIEQSLAAGKLGRQVSLDRLVDWLMVCTLRD